MSILIKGMEMPTSCSVCWALDDYGDYPRCRITEEQRGYTFPIREKRMDNCPLVPVPPHGRMIDADAPIEVWEVRLSDGDSCSFRNIETTVSKFLLSHLMGEVPPTIIPKEGE